MHITEGLLISFLFIAAQGCNNNLNIVAPFKNIPVVYGLMDQYDSIHYVRIQRIFGGGGDALASAQSYDSLYFPYKNITAVVDDYNNGVLQQTFVLDTTTLIPMEPGIFSYPKMMLYYFKAGLNTSDKYVLRIKNLKSNDSVSASTTLLSYVPISGLTAPFMPVSWNNLSPSTISWEAQPGSYIFQLSVLFTYTETNKANNDSTIHTISWDFFPLNTFGGAQLQYQYLTQDFMHFLADNIPVPPDTLITRRAHDTVSFVFTSGSLDLYSYWQAEQPTYTPDQEHPTYTNIKNAVGVFTSKHTQVMKKYIRPDVLDSIAHGAYTRQLGFEPY